MYQFSAIYYTHVLTTKRGVEFDESLSRTNIYDQLVTATWFSASRCVFVSFAKFHSLFRRWCTCPSRDVITFFRQINTDFVNYTFSKLFASLFLEQPSGTGGLPHFNRQLRFVQSSTFAYNGRGILRYRTVSCNNRYVALLLNQNQHWRWRI